MASCRARSLRIVLPTYALARPGKFADFGWCRGFRIYPYPRLDAWENAPTERTYKAISLENEYLEVTVLPELGGKVWGALDKLTGRELFFRNDTVKPGPLAPRGAWVAGGVEFSFPAGHPFHAVDPVEWRVAEDRAGVASVMLGATDQRTGLRWRVTLSLRRGERRLVQDVVLDNPTLLPQPFFYWTNAALEVSDSTRFVYPMHEAYSDEYPVGRFAYPHGPGGDFSYYRNIERPSSVFGIVLSGDYFGAYDPERRFGTFHWAPLSVLPGRKFWTWGTGDEGLVWCRRLSDRGDPRYIEIQAGLFLTQGVLRLMGPLNEIRFREYWIPVSGLDSVDFVTPHAGFELLWSGGAVGAIRVAPTVSGKLRVRVQRGDLFLNEAVFDAAPGKIEVVDLNGELTPTRDVPLRIVLEGEDGALDQVEWPPRPVDMGPTVEERYLTTVGAFVPSASSETGLGEDPEFLELRGALGAACSALRGATVSGDPGKRTCLLARVLLRMGLFGEAAEALAQACSEGRSAGPEAAYYRGLALLHSGDGEGAQPYLFEALSSPGFGWAARLALVHLAIISGERARAFEFLAAAEAREAPSVVKESFSVLRAYLHRMEGLLGPAKEAVREALTMNPISYGAAWEAFLLGEDHALASVENRAAFLRSVTEELWRLRRWSDLDVLLAEATEATAVVVRAAALSRAGRSQEARESLDRANLEAPGSLFAWTRAEVEACEELATTWPNHPLPWLLLGHFYQAVDRIDAAEIAWSRALALAPGSEMAAHALRGLSQCAATRGDWAKAAAYACEATDRCESEVLYSEADACLGKLAPESPWTTYRAVASVARSVAEVRLGLARQAMARGLTSTQGLSRAVRALLAAGHVEQAVQLFERYQWAPFEGMYSPRLLYVTAWLLCGAAAWSRGDFHRAAESFRRARLHPPTLGLGRPALESLAQAYYLEGLALYHAGDRAGAVEAWRKAADDPAPAWTEANYYVIRALQRLGDRGAAQVRLEQWRQGEPPTRPLSRQWYLKGLLALAEGRDEDGRAWLDAAWAREVFTGEGWEFILSSQDTMVPEHRVPIAAWWVVEPELPTTPGWRSPGGDSLGKPHRVLS